MWCLRCGYPITGEEEASKECPECGTALSLSRSRAPGTRSPGRRLFSSIALLVLPVAALLGSPVSLALASAGPINRVEFTLSVTIAIAAGMTCLGTGGFVALTWPPAVLEAARQRWSVAAVLVGLIGMMMLGEVVTALIRPHALEADLARRWLLAHILIPVVAASTAWCVEVVGGWLKDVRVVQSARRAARLFVVAGLAYAASSLLSWWGKQLGGAAGGTDAFASFAYLVGLAGNAGGIFFLWSAASIYTVRVLGRKPGGASRNRRATA